MAIAYYDKAEIYLTSCIHPDFSYLRYLGLDTKADPNYLGSSVTLKWFINRLGRSSFKKEILEVTEGTMREVCAVEQRYILAYNAVKDVNYLNMNGGVQKHSMQEELVISMDYNILAAAPISHDFINGVVAKIKSSISFFSHSKQQLARRILCMVCYGYLKYEQEAFDYNNYTYYGSNSCEDLQDILAAFSNLGILDSGFSNIKITETFIDNLPVGMTYQNFSVKNDH